MINYEEIVDLFKRHLYVVFSEHYVGTSGDGRKVERYIAKHPKLRPEFILKDGELEGFKKTSAKLKKLEEFSIYLEIDSIDLEEEWGIESIDLYAEASLNIQPRLKDIIYLAKLFEPTVSMERIIPITDITHENILINSKIGNIFLDLEDDQDLFFADQHIVKQQMKFILSEFCLFIQCVHDIIIKNKPLDKILEEIGTSPGNEHHVRKNPIY